MITSLDFQKYSFLAPFRDLISKSPSAFSIEHFHAKKYLIIANTASDMDLFLILSGVCIVQLATSNLKDTAAMPYHIYPGNFIGAREIIFPDPPKRFADVIAKTKVTALRINGKAFYEWPDSNRNHYNMVLANILEKEYAKNNMIYQCAAFDGTTATAYILHYLYHIYLKSCYPKSYTGFVRIPETHHDLSVLIARTQRTVDRALRTLQCQDLISVQRGSIYIDSPRGKKLFNYIHTH